MGLKDDQRGLIKLCWPQKNFRSAKGAPMVAQNGKLAEETVLEIEEAFDFQTLDLSPEEGFLLSRIVGPRQTVKEVCEASGMARQDAMPLLEQLVAKGVCTISEPWEEATALDEDELLLAKADELA